MDQQFVYQLGDGSRLCVKCLKNYLDEIGEPNNITNGQILSLENGLPLYGWNIGKCTEDECISRKEKENELRERLIDSINQADGTLLQVMDNVLSTYLF